MENNFPQQGPVDPSQLPKTDANESEQPTSAQHNENNDMGLPQGNPFEQQSTGPIGAQSEKETAAVPPPPESLEEKVAVRTMSSDMESIKQTGGEAPESEIVTAPEIKIDSQKDTEATEQPPVQPTQPAQSAQSEISETEREVAPGAISETEQQIMSQNIAAEQPAQQPAQMQQPKSQTEDGPQKPLNIPQEQAAQPSIKTSSGFPTKTVLTIAGIVILAAIVGFGVYYLVSALKTEPTIPQQPAPSNNNQLPIDLNNGNEEKPAPEQKEEPQFVHSSLIVNPDDKVDILAKTTTKQDIKTALLSAIDPILSEGAVRDMTIYKGSEENKTLMTSDEILSALLPEISDKFSPMIDKDFTSWIYFDKRDTISPKFGMIFKLLDNANLDAASATFAEVEQYPASIANVFIDEVSTPADTKFDDGSINGIKVRFLQFSPGNVFEYGWLTNDSGTYLILGASYKQMVDIISRLTPQQNGQ